MERIIPVNFAKLSDSPAPEGEAQVLQFPQFSSFFAQRHPVSLASADFGHRGGHEAREGESTRELRMDGLIEFPRDQIDRGGR